MKPHYPPGRAERVDKAALESERGPQQGVRSLAQENRLRKMLENRIVHNPLQASLRALACLAVGDFQRQGSHYPMCSPHWEPPQKKTNLNPTQKRTHHHYLTEKQAYFQSHK
jgi:hypothetical protein